MKKLLTSVLVLIIASTSTLTSAHNIKAIEELFNTILNVLGALATDVAARAGRWDNIAKIKDINWHCPRNEMYDSHYICITSTSFGYDINDTHKFYGFM